MRYAALLAVAVLASPALAQNAPAPGPTNPSVLNPQAKPGATIVVNPTEQECRQGWSNGLRWTKEQFDEYCTKLGASK